MKIPYRVKETIKNSKYECYKEVKNKSVYLDKGDLVVFDMRDLFPDRNLVQIVRRFKEVGYNVCIYLPNYFYWLKAAFLHDWSYSEFVFGCTVIRKIPDNVLIWVTGKKRKGYKNKRVIVVSDEMRNAPAKYVEEEFYYPILMHPLKLEKKIEKRMLMRKHVERNIGILFIGNVDSSIYSKHEKNLHKKYNVFSRPEVVNFIKKNCANILYEPESFEDFERNYLNGKLTNKIVLIDKFRVQDKYEELLRDSRFFLFLSGDDHPFCHNQIEAVASGCIPITHFSEYYPNLINEKNCFCYTTLGELKDICERLCMNAIINSYDMMKMEHEVTCWYKNFWSFDAFDEKIKKIVTSSSCDVIYHIAKGLSPICDKIEKITGFKF